MQRSKKRVADASVDESHRKVNRFNGRTGNSRAEPEATPSCTKTSTLDRSRRTRTLVRGPFDSTTGTEISRAKNADEPTAFRLSMTTCPRAGAHSMRKRSSASLRTSIHVDRVPSKCASMSTRSVGRTTSVLAAAPRDRPFADCSRREPVDWRVYAYPRYCERILCEGRSSSRARHPSGPCRRTASYSSSRSVLF